MKLIVDWVIDFFNNNYINCSRFYGNDKSFLLVLIEYNFRNIVVKKKKFMIVVIKFINYY